MIQSFKDLVVYQKAFEQAMRLFEVSKSFPKAELYSLTDQIRCASRSVCTNIGEAWSPTRREAGQPPSPRGEFAVLRLLIAQPKPRLPLHRADIGLGETAQGP
jgi:hypothetical protein